MSVEERQALLELGKTNLCRTYWKPGCAKKILICVQIMWFMSGCGLIDCFAPLTTFYMQEKKSSSQNSCCLFRSAMQFPCKRLYYSRFQPTPKHLQLLWLAVAMLLCMYVSHCGSSSCPSPCDMSACPRLVPRNCAHRYRDACNCCEYCGGGPGEFCEGLYNAFGYCATGLECVKELEEGLPPEQQVQLPGVCTGKE